MRLIFLLLFSFSAFAQTLSPSSRISLLTISPGEELYSTFGHSAIRVWDPALGIDVNYNYGSFDFNAPGFYLKFVRGYLDYMITSHPAYLEFEYWNRENRKITEQVLNLSLAQRQRVYEFLENNLKPENKNYRYKFFTDNCSTRLRDVLQIAAGDSLVFNQALNADSTYRQWIDKYAHENGKSWADFGMDLAIGADSDKKTGWADAMFIPDNLMKAVDQAKVLTVKGEENLVILKRDLNQISEIKKQQGMSPVVFFALFAVLMFFLNKAGVGHGFDKFLFSVLGIAGWILLALWFLTDHGVTKYNWNLLWASPFVFPAILSKRTWSKYAFRIYGLGLLVFMVAAVYYWGFNLQNGLVFLWIGIVLRTWQKIKRDGIRKD